jgi:hypothetical protein
MTGPKKGCSLLPREVVLLGCGNSGNGGKRRGVFLFLFPSATVSRLTVSRQSTVNPRGTGTGMDGRTPSGGFDNSKGERGYILDSRCEAYCWIYLGNATTVNKNNKKKDKGKTNVIPSLYYC